MFPSVIPLYGTDCSRVTHPSAAGMFSVQALRTSPLDLHVLSTPPAFVLSQDQTLMFDLSQEALPPRTTRQSRPQRPSSCCLLSQNLTVLVASIFPLSMENTRFSSFSVSFSRFACRPPAHPSPPGAAPSFQAAYAIIAMSRPIVKGFWQLFSDFLCVKRIPWISCAYINKKRFQECMPGNSNG